jgi:hypothetical protein
MIMQICGHYDYGKDDILTKHPCTRNPYHCTWFRAFRYRCPYLIGQLDEAQYAEWRRFKTEEVNRRGGILQFLRGLQ